MRLEHLLIGFPGLLLLATLLGYTENGGQQMQRLNGLVSAQVQAGPERMPLNQDYLIVRRPGGEQHKLPVILVMRVYSFKALLMREGKPRLWNHRLHSYEIRAVGENDLFCWNICSLGRPLGMFRLFSNERGENHLAWVEGRSVCFSQVKEPRDRLVAITDVLANEGGHLPGIVRVPTDRLIDREHHGWNALYSELAVEALEVSESGIVTMKVSALRPDKVFTLVYDGKEWRKE